MPHRPPKETVLHKRARKALRGYEPRAARRLKYTNDHLENVGHASVGITAKEARTGIKFV